MELVVAQPGVGQAFHRRHIDRPAEGARLAKSHVVDQHDEDIGAPAGALTSNRGGGVALRASNTVLCGILGSGIGSTVRSVGGVAGVCALREVAQRIQDKLVASSNLWLRWLS